MHDSEFLFSYKVRQALDQNLTQLHATTANALMTARHAAIRRKKNKAPLTAWIEQKATSRYVGFAIENAPIWARRLAMTVPVMVAMVGIFGIYQFQQQLQLNELADAETQVMNDELPVAAYLDKGFTAYLEQQDKSSNSDISFIQTNVPMSTHRNSS